MYEPVRGKHWAPSIQFEIQMSADRSETKYDLFLKSHVFCYGGVSPTAYLFRFGPHSVSILDQTRDSSLFAFFPGQFI